MSVTLSEVTRAAKAHRAPLAGESAGYLVLAIADQVLSAPRLVQPGEIQLSEDGALSVLSGRASSDADAELALRRALDGLLLVASSGSAALARASRRTSPLGLSSLVRELEAALIPVNRSAAKRALARLHRETTRALLSGALPDEEPAPSAEVVVAPVVVAPVVAAPVVAAPAIVLELDSEPETREIRVAPAPAVDLSFSPQWNAMLNALCEESPELEAPDEQGSDALTIALDVRGVSVAPPALSYEEDVEFDDVDLESESGTAPTVVRDAPVGPVLHALAAVWVDLDDDALSEIPVEACTRPEPVMLRKTMRPVPAEIAELTELAPLVGEIHARTPMLGSLVAQLPVLPPGRLAELSVQVECEPSAAPLAVAPSVEAPEEQEQVMCSARSELTSLSAEPAEPTEPMPEVAPLLPGVAIVASRKSDVSELLQSFQVAGDDSDQGLRRAIKEMAELDLTPAPFAALIR
ncbi:MAG: hypothetical protein ABI548_13315 [Polyangiaceae bacterium]